MFTIKEQIIQQESFQLIVPNFAINLHEITLLVGKNGTGKTTFCNFLSQKMNGTIDHYYIKERIKNNFLASTFLADSTLFPQQKASLFAQKYRVGASQGELKKQILKYCEEMQNKYLIFDDPLLHLDEKGRNNFRNIILAKERKYGCFIVTTEVTFYRDIKRKQLQVENNEIIQTKL